MAVTSIMTPSANPVSASSSQIRSLCRLQFGARSTRRGILFFMFAYILNLIAIFWHGFFSWYILHLLGVAVFVGVFFQNKPPLIKLASGYGVIILAPILRLVFEVPPVVAKDIRHLDFLEGISAPLDIFRNAFLQGDFPIFPFLGFFLFGMFAYHYKDEIFHKYLKYNFFTSLGLTIVLYVLALSVLAGNGFFTIGEYWPVSMYCGRQTGAYIAI